MTPSSYKHIAAFGRVCNWDKRTIYNAQRHAARHDAPVDAVYSSNRLDARYRIADYLWATIADVGVLTRMAIEVELNRGAK